ncbi:MAG TPA: hypothetical protein VN776_07605 [Terracidiphilus sp.]|nr:hypothetical protein [Terracidiphilus sp.]
MGRTALALAAGLLVALPALAQYPGQVSKGGKDTPELRAIAVLEWTGDEGKPKASRLVPVTVLDGGELQDGGIYLARPEPMAVFPEVEYELQQNGQPVGLYDISNAGQQQGSWVGFGAWKPMPSAKPRPSPRELAQTHLDDDAQSDVPVLHRKHHADDAPSSGSSGSGADAGGQAQPSDPDRPVLHKKTSSDNTDNSSTGTNAGNTSPATVGAGPTNSSSDTDPDRPTLHRKSTSSDSAGSGSSSSSAPSDDPDRPVLKKSRKSEPADVGRVESVAGDTDPDRPKLKRGKSSGDAVEVAPSLVGVPPDAQQMVAVSDAKRHPVHPWTYAWSNPDDEAKMKSALEDIARDALGLNPPPAPAKPTAKRAPVRKTTKPPPPPPPPAPLEDEQFRVFELAYGSGATLVLSAHTDGPAPQQKFVTLIAQPDLYGNVLVLKKNVTDGAHLDEKPRMRLVDAVDALADNRGELLFELRGANQRQFALYRVLRGQAEQLFVTGAGQFGT